MNNALSQDQNKTPRGTARILYVSDPSSIARKLLPDPVREEDLRHWVDWVADSGVDIFDQEVFSMGWTVYWRSDRYEYDRRPQHHRFLPLLADGIQPLEILIDQAHQRGMRFIAGIRINDNHGHQAREQGVGIAEFIESNPQLQLKDLPEGEYYKLSEPLDFSHAEVREFTVGVVRELCDRFAIDGVELCYRDHAYFPWDSGAERAELMTDMVRRIRDILDAPSTGRLLLGARVFSTVEECTRLGLDAPAWIGENLIDYISPQDSMYADFSVPYQSWAALTRASECMLYPGLLPWTSFRARYRRRQSPISADNARALTHTMYRAGADGLSLYNHFVPTLWHPPFYPQAMQVFHQLRDPTAVAGRERHYIFDPTWAGMEGFGAEGKCSTGAVKAQRILLDRENSATRGEYRFCLYEDLAKARGATLMFRGAGLTADDELEVCLNGHPIPDDDIGRTLASDAEPPTLEDYVREEGEIKIPCFPELGWYDFRPQPGPVFSTRWFELPLTIAYGENVLSIALIHSVERTEHPIVIDEVEVWVEPTQDKR